MLQRWQVPSAQQTAATVIQANSTCLTIGHWGAGEGWGLFNAGPCCAW